MIAKEGALYTGANVVRNSTHTVGEKCWLLLTGGNDIFRNGTDFFFFFFLLGKGCNLLKRETSPIPLVGLQRFFVVVV